MSKLIQFAFIIDNSKNASKVNSKLLNNSRRTKEFTNYSDSINEVILFT